MSPRQESLLTWGLVALCAVLVAWNLYPRLSVQQVPVTVLTPDITVSVAGAVHEPGVYELPWGATVDDLISAAGGFTPDAEPTLVNLADPLDTGEMVVVPKARTERGEMRISLNSSSQRELERLPGVGPTIAGRIIEARPYAEVEELLDVDGIGVATLEELRPLVKP